MKMNILKYFLILFLPIALLYVCAFPYLGDGMATVKIINQSEEIVAMLQVTVHEDIKTVEDLKPGEEVEMQFLVKRDTHYHIDIEFISGRKIWKDVGYLTSMTRISDKVIINKADIELERISVENSAE